MRRRALEWLAGLAVLATSPCLALPEAGEPAPRFALRDFFDATKLVRATVLFQGKHTLVSFFATWCKPCKQEIPELRKLGESYGDRGVQVILVCLDRLGARDVGDYLKEAGAGGTTVLWDRYGAAQKEFGAVQLPANVLVGPTGDVVMAWEGYLPARLAELGERFEALPRTGAPVPARPPEAAEGAAKSGARR